jgi:hypothetical protein
MRKKGKAVLVESAKKWRLVEVAGIITRHAPISLRAVGTTTTVPIAPPR